MKSRQSPKAMRYFIFYTILASVSLMLTIPSVQAEECLANVVNYDIVYVRMPRRGDEDNSIKWPEVINPAYVEPGSDLMLLHPDCSEELLYEAGIGAVTDPFVSFDGKKIFFSFFSLQFMMNRRFGIVSSFL